MTLRIDKVVAEGDGLGRDSSGKVVFVEGALPGELVSARVVSESKDYARAVLIEVVEAHPQRVEPMCRYVASGCGGCDLQHADEDLQIEIKVGIVEESLRRLGGIPEPDVRAVRSSNQDTRLRTTVRVAASGSAIGFRRRRSHEVVAIESCPVAHPRINEILAQLELTGGSDAVVRVSHGGSGGVVWTEPAENLVSHPPDVRIGSEASVYESVAGVDFRISASSFFQSSPGAAEILVEAVRRAIGDASLWPDGPVVDAYGGVGLFAATVVPPDRPVVLLESNPASCADARVNLAGRDADIIVGRVEDWHPIPAAIVIADPARDGLRAKSVEVLTRCEPAVVALVSCDPASLGRDARLLAAAGYRLEYSQVLDVFPHTHHVEAVSRFVRNETREVP